MIHPGRWFVSGAALLSALLALAAADPGGTTSPAAQRRVPATGQSLPRVIRDLQYRKAGGPQTSMDLYLPSANPTGQRLPVVVWVHGGGWYEGDKTPCPIASGTSYGYAIASVNYRLSGKSPFPAQLEDCRAAIRFLRANAANYGLDPDHIGVWGESAGGHLAALLGTTEADDANDQENPGVSSRVQAVCDQYGPTDLAALLAEVRQRDPHNPLLAEPNPVTRLLGGKPQGALAAQANPIRFVTPDDPPFLIVHGEQDRLVPLSQSQALAERLREAKVAVELVCVPGVGHGGPEFWQGPLIQRITSFFDRHLKAPTAGRQD